MRENRFQQRERVRSVVAKIFFRPLHGFAGFDERREVHHRLRLELAKHLPKQRAVRNVADDQSGRSGKRDAMSVRKIIENDGLVTAIQQLRDNHASDVASATRYEYSLCHARDGLVSKRNCSDLNSRLMSAVQCECALLWQVIVICGAKHSAESNFGLSRLSG